MGGESDCFYMIEEGTVSVEAQFVDVPVAQRAVDYPVNVANSSSNWCVRPHVLLENVLPPESRVGFIFLSSPDSVEQNLVLQCGPACSLNQLQRNLQSSAEIECHI